MIIILDQEQIPYSLETIYVGIKLQLLIKKDLEYYVDKNLSIEDSEQNKPFIKLIVEDYTEAALISCMQHFNIDVPAEDSSLWQHAIRTLRYAYLRLLAQRNFTDAVLLEKVASFWEHMNYPFDMVHLIYYMPFNHEQENVQQRSIEESRKRLIQKLYIFLDNEKLILTSKPMKENPLKDFGFTCCFCNTTITSTNNDPCDLNILSNFDKSEDEQVNQTFYCHTHCFKKTLHENVQDYFVIGSSDKEQSEYQS